MIIDECNEKNSKNGELYEAIGEVISKIYQEV
jgi:hypothetical protein